jgi:hypothetical protein
MQKDHQSPAIDARAPTLGSVSGVAIAAILSSLEVGASIADSATTG